jgi:hypothetical protein
MARMDLNDPTDVQALVNNGYAWKAGPKSLQRIFRLIVSGQVKRVPEKETPQVSAYLDKIAPIAPEPSPVVSDEAEPVEEAVEPMVEPGA